MSHNLDSPGEDAVRCMKHSFPQRTGSKTNPSPIKQFLLMYLLLPVCAEAPSAVDRVTSGLLP